MDKGRTDGVFGALFTAFLYMRGRVSICSCLFQFSFSFFLYKGFCNEEGLIGEYYKI